MTPQEQQIQLREQFLFILLEAGATETDESTRKCVDVVATAVITALRDKEPNFAETTYWHPIDFWEQLKGGSNQTHSDNGGETT